MIAYVRGVLVEKSPTRAIVEAAGVGYELLIPISTYERVFVLRLVPFHSPVTTPTIVEKKIVEAIITANEMYLRSPIRGSPAFVQTNCSTQITPIAAHSKTLRTDGRV